ncbi:Acetyl esterase/lipase [Quadrisphaera granulorum]|uniref:Acetyl esterase/lipase n=1 Tax=Quadrisphaera granulorum TaxID=317664 RepID=A0A315ZTK4_9ACTN|nr:alpha/beta hydrolase [Quadrisphaera granulorum]PWJ48639.1 acetyl esterase/lipase [Quadrisphaera granulorum]SZE98361.1 Acetyl esterase/lipase [Quadrisphaera granulorum]
MRRARATAPAAPVLAALMAMLIGGLLGGCADVPPPSLTPPPSATSSVVVEEDLPYRTVDGEKLLADVCRPREATGALPAMILVHGGGFSQGGKKDVRSLCETLAKQGVVGVAISYRLLPDHAFPSQVEDVVAAMSWVADPAIARQHDIDPARIGLLGSSAGAIIAESVGVGIGSPPFRPAVVAAFSGASDFTPGASGGVPSGGDAERLALAYLGCASVAACPTAEAASPAKHVTAESSPMFLVNGSEELIPVGQPQAMSDALAASGVAQQLVVVPGNRHGLDLLTPDVLRAMQDFLSQHL